MPGVRTPKQRVKYRPRVPAATLFLQTLKSGLSKEVTLEVQEGHLRYGLVMGVLGTVLSKWRATVSCEDWLGTAHEME